MINKETVDKLGFIDLPLDSDIDLVEEINRLRKEKNAVILAHYYQNPEIQDIADFVGDSLALAVKAKSLSNKLIVFAGVKFMGETTKILVPDAKVILPDMNAGCSLADSCPYDKFKDFVDKHPDHTVVTYVNTNADIKTISDICCTSSNAVNVIKSIPEDKPIILAPDRNLGNYIKNKLKRENMLIWDGFCHVHQRFSLEKLVQLKKENPHAKIIAHPECQKTVLLLADYIGSTSQLIDYTANDDSMSYIVATEYGVIHQMKLKNPSKNFIPAPPEDSTCGCNDCSFMKMINLKKLYFSLKYEYPTIELPEDIIKRARLPIERMIAIK
ncbi:quinolinate synthase NadA [Tenuifilum thalassicum]|uniref:Quinolinate synthase n=1 Tax=Tenuifilum thalassicum TaxID=2590900 RepID=A0A7D4BXY8_9BACT|nr:quinolinate synthase NadA [Tenuifilum thalassicum]QKG78724.1 quinolinate synthase NadA [Tenuifilum thalassicum]